MTASDPDFPFGPDAVEVLERQTCFQGYFRMDRYRLRHRLFTGGMGREIRREVLERGHAVAVLPYDPEKRVIVLIEQFRIGAYAAGWRPWLLEVVAGIIEPGENPEDVARRELTEEAGCEALDLLPIHSMLVSPGALSETVRLFCARVHAPEDGALHGLPGEGEDIRVRLIPEHEVAAMLETGRINNASTLIALQWFQLHGAALRTRWADTGARSG